MTAYNDIFEQEHEDQKATGSDAHLLRRLMGYLRPYMPQVVVILLLLVIVSALGIAGPWLVKLTIDRALTSDASNAERLTMLLRITGIYIGVLVVTAGVHYAQIMMLQTTGQRVMFDLRRQLFRHLLRQDMTLFDRQPVGRLMTRLTSDIDALNELFTSGVVTVAMDVFTLVFIMGAMVWMDWRLALLSFSIIPCLFLLSMVFRSRVRRAFRKIRVRVARINSFLQEHLAGISVVQSFGQEPRRLRRFDQLNEDHTNAHLETVAAFSVFFPAVEVLSTAAVTLLLWKGAGLVASEAITLGTLVAFVQYAQRFYRPISDLAEKVNILQGAMAASERIFELLDRQPNIRTVAEPKGSDRVRGEVVFDNVRFGYEATSNDGGNNDSMANNGSDDEPRERKIVLDGLSFRVEAGERIAIVGSTGAGKTTVISLMTRFYDVQEGRILVDGVDVREWEPRGLRHNIGVVLQDPRLFSGTLRENLTLWRDNVDKLDDAIERVGLDSVIAGLPDGIDEVMREGGSRLSTGERQLVAFARALAHDPPILVLDEATASVDSETEARIQAAIEELLRGRTSITIAHRLSTVRNADRILVLHKGRLHEQGTHRELMDHDGLYRRLVDMQLKSASVDAS